MPNHVDTLKSLKKCQGISDIFNVFMTSMSDFHVILQFFATASVIKLVETLFSHKSMRFDRFYFSVKFNV